VQDESREDELSARWVSQNELFENVTRKDELFKSYVISRLTAWYCEVVHDKL